MKKYILIPLALALATATAMAQADLVKQRAVGIRDMNNARQGITPAAPPTMVNPGTATPVQPQGMSAAQQQLLDRLENDLKAIKLGTEATPEQKQGLQNDLNTLAKGATKPSKAALTKFTGDLCTGLADKALATKDLAQLTKDINIVLNCAPFPAAKAQSFVADAQTVLKTAGVAEPSVIAICADLKGLVTEIQANKPKLYQ